jgi:acetyl esterase
MIAPATASGDERQMTTDPDAQRLVDLLRTVGRARPQDVPVAEARRSMLAGRNVLQPPPVAVADVRDMAIAGEGGEIRLRLYRGTGAPAERSAGLVFYHGGGWVLGDLDTHDGVCRAMAEGAGCCVVAVDYRLAPEHPFPAAVNDAATAWAWVVAEAVSLGMDPARIAIGGDSAGGNLAAVVCLMARDAAGMTMPAAQILLYPAVDLTLRHDSYARITAGVPLTADLVVWFRDRYLPDAAAALDWRASPLRAAHLRDLPPAFVLTVGQDPLCDEGIDYARQLDAAGVQVAHLHLPNQIHGFLTMGRIIRAAGMALATVCAYLRRL